MKNQAEFERFNDRSDTRIASFPNEKVWDQGGFRPNRQLLAPEAGYCVILRYPEDVAGALSRFAAEIRTVLPPVVAYCEASLHTTIGVYRKGDLEAFVPDPNVQCALKKAVEEGVKRCEGPLRIALETWLFNHEAVLCAGKPNLETWNMVQSIGAACSQRGLELEMARMLHVSVARWITGVDELVFKKFVDVMARAPALGPVHLAAVDVATWRCDGLTFVLDVHHRFRLGS